MSIIRVRTRLAGFRGGPGLMTHYFTNPAGDIANDSVQDSINRVRDACTAAAGLWPSTLTWTVSGEVEVITIATAAIASVEQGTGATGVGASGEGECGPGNIGTIVKLRTAGIVNGRRVLGKTFLVPQTKTNASHELPDPTNVATALAFGTALLDAGFGNVYPVVYSRPFEGRPASAGPPIRKAIPARPGTAWKVTSVAVERKFASLRSRRD